MTTVQKLGVGIIAIGLATALLMKDRQFVPAVNAFFQGARGLLGTAMGTARPV